MQCVCACCAGKQMVSGYWGGTPTRQQAGMGGDEDGEKERGEDENEEHEEKKEDHD